MVQLAISRTLSHRPNQRQSRAIFPMVSRNNSVQPGNTGLQDLHGIGSPRRGSSSPTGGGSGMSVRHSLDIRTGPEIIGSPAKSRMLWREGFTPREIENISMNDREVKRQEVLFEIIHTEADYVKDLKTTVDILITPMRTLRVLSNEKIDLIFGNLEEILSLHKSISMALMERHRKEYPVIKDVSDVLLPYIGQFRIYAKYICNQDNALRLIEELKKTSHNFSIFWKERQKRPECRGLSIESFLVLPFQRLLKYPLLLHNLLEVTDEWSQEYSNGNLLYQQIDGWINKIQDAKLKLESYSCLDSIVRSIRDVDLSRLLDSGSENRLLHSGVVRTCIPQIQGTPTAANPRATNVRSSLPPDESSEVWLFDNFVIVARPLPSADARSLLASSNINFGSGAGSSTGAIGKGRARGGSWSTGPSRNPGIPKYRLTLGPCQIVEALPLGGPDGSLLAVHLHVIPLDVMSKTAGCSSIVMRFGTQGEHDAWREKIDEHIMHSLTTPPSVYSSHLDKAAEDELSAAIAAATISDGKKTRPSSSCISDLASGRPVSSACDASMSEVSTISIKEIYVPFPASQPKSKFKRGWNFIRNKTENITGRNLKRQLKKYGGGGGKRLASDPAIGQDQVSPPKHAHTPTPAAAIHGLGDSVSPPPTPNKISTPIMIPRSSSSSSHQSSMPPSTADNSPMLSSRHALGIFQTPKSNDSSSQLASMRQSRRNFSIDSIVLKSYSSYSCRRSEDSGLRLDQGSQRGPKLEYGSAMLACSSDSTSSSSIVTETINSNNGAGNDVGAGAPITIKPSPLTLENMESFTDSDLSSSELTPPVIVNHYYARPPYHRQPSTRHTLGRQSRQHIQVPDRLNRRTRALHSLSLSSRKPAPQFEVGSAKLMYNNNSNDDGSRRDQIDPYAGSIRTGKSSELRPQYAEPALSRPSSWYTGPFTTDVIDSWVEIENSEQPSDLDGGSRVGKKGSGKGKNAKFCASYTLGKYLSVGEARLHDTQR